MLFVRLLITFMRWPRALDITAGTFHHHSLRRIEYDPGEHIPAPRFAQRQVFVVSTPSHKKSGPTFMGGMPISPILRLVCCRSEKIGESDWLQFTQEAQRLQCAVVLQSGEFGHAGPHTHSLDAASLHLCEATCKHCGYYCVRRYGMVP
jgi:hypothetical protein